MKHLKLLFLQTTVLLIILSCNGQQTTKNNLAAQLTKTNYIELFLSSNSDRLLDSIWQDGKNKEVLLQIVLHASYNDYARLLASEVLYIKAAEYPPANLQDTLAYIYTQALKITGGDTANVFSIPGNPWGFPYYDDQGVNTYYGELGSHLIKTGKNAIPFLTILLSNNNNIGYFGSKEATVGNGLNLRVKDAAAYYIGKIANITVQFYEKHADRDKEIERLKEKLKNSK